MYEKIVDNYYTEADEAFKGTALEDSASIQELKDSTKKRNGRAEKTIWTIEESTNSRKRGNYSISKRLS